MARTWTEQVTDFAAGLRYDQIPEEVIANGKLRILDTLGIALASSPMDFAQIMLATAQSLGRGDEATVIGSDLKLPTANAVLVNGTTAHGLDWDDTHSEAVVHASTVVVPTALAVAEAQGRGGRDALAAAVAGWETIVRLGQAAAGQFHAMGYHATSICGTFAAAMIAGKLMGSNADTMASALGIAGSQTSGVLEFLADGSWVKRLHPGWASHAGIIAATLGAKGYTGPHSILEGRYGLYNTHVQSKQYQIERLTAGLGQSWETLNICFKPYPCCHFNHSFMDAAAALKQAHGFSPDEVVDVECRIAEQEIPVVCEPRAEKLAPRTPYHAQFSLPYAVSLVLTQGHAGLDDFGPSRYTDPALRDLSSRVRHVVDPESSYPRFFPGWVRVTLKDGRVLEHKVPYNRGTPENPMSQPEVVDKFRANAGRVLPAGAVEAIIEQVDRLETLPSLEPLMALCRPSRVPAGASR